jgi:1-deoxy-D-xylulose-5-phosphate reductoisomerase
MSALSSADGRVGVALLGSTGSIGRQAVDVLAGLPGRFRVVALATGRTVDVLTEQVGLLRPDVVAVADASAAARLDLPAGTTLVGGEDALVELATRPDVDLVVVGSGGVVSLRPVLAALAAGKVVATANKETLVAGGHLVMPLARALAARRDPTGGDPSAFGAGAFDAGVSDPYASPLAWLRPIDSEHSAIWQCLVGEPRAAIARLVLTASGGPFLDTPAEELALVTPERALRHPIWRMGAKITIDSATLANKGLEVIEAHWLYDVDYDAIEVVIHPQSVVHSAVRFVDGSLKAQLGTPDMRLPIQYALTYPERLPSPAAPPDLVATGQLDFRAPDETRFPSLAIARDAGRRGPAASAALIAADEVAVARFLEGTLDFPGIPRLLEAAVARSGGAGEPPDLAALVALDAEVRAFARGWRPRTASVSGPGSARS